MWLHLSLRICYLLNCSAAGAYPKQPHEWGSSMVEKDGAQVWHEDCIEALSEAIPMVVGVTARQCVLGVSRWVADVGGGALRDQDTPRRGDSCFHILGMAEHGCAQLCWCSSACHLRSWHRGHGGPHRHGHHCCAWTI
jgi:hypothetical protein